MKLYPLIKHLLLEHKLSLDKSVQNFNKEKIKYLKLFIDFVCTTLELQDSCDIVLINDRKKYNITTAGYNPSNNKTYIWVNGRHFIDIIRSISHELKHQKQRELGILTPESGKDGDKFENEANSFSGTIIRKFQRKYPEIYDL